MKRNRPLALLATLVTVSLPMTAVHAAGGPGDGSERRGTDHSRRTVVTNDFVAKAEGSDDFIGTDGQVYQPAPVAVPGLEGELFYGPDFDVACGLGGKASVTMERASKLARVIENSGRRVIWTAGPNKTTVLSRRLDLTQLPHGACDQAGLKAQQKVVDGFAKKDPLFLPMRALLAKDPRQVYFKTDPHWTTVGASLFAVEVAKELSSRLAKRQRYTYGTETRVGLLNAVRDIDETETAETASPIRHVRVSTDRKSVEDWSGYPNTTLDYSWNAWPAKKTWPGQTLLLGDSFMLYALESLRPLFHHGRFMFVGHVKDRDVIRAIKQSDTVVFELLQTFIAFKSILTEKKFRAKLRRALN